MENPFFFSSDPWSATARRRPSGRGTQRPLFYVADPRSAPDCYSGKTYQPPESLPPRALEPAPAARPPVVSIPVHFVRSDAIAEPVGPIRPETSMSGAAIAIQRVFRGHLVRKNIKLLSQVAFEVGEIEGRIHADEARLRVDPKERLLMNEMLMAQLLRLDSVRWVREYRRKVIRKVIALQEFLDAIAAQSVESPNSQAAAEMNLNHVDSSDMSNDAVSNTISQNAICAVAAAVSQESKAFAFSGDILRRRDMSMMELPSGAVPKSTLNPNAPLFIPMAFKQVQDFSPEWWELVKTNTWFREHWFHMHQDQETFDADEDEDVANLLPDSIDLEIGSELSMLGADAEQVFLQQSVQEVAMNKDMINLGFLNDAEAAVRGFGSRASKNGIRTLSEPAKYHEKPVHRMSPKFASRHFIQQPR